MFQWQREGHVHLQLFGHTVALRPMRATRPGSCSPGVERRVMTAFLPAATPRSCDSSHISLTQTVVGSARVKIASPGVHRRPLSRSREMMMPSWGA